MRSRFAEPSRERLASIGDALSAGWYPSLSSSEREAFAAYKMHWGPPINDLLLFGERGWEDRWSHSLLPLPLAEAKRLIWTIAGALERAATAFPVVVYRACERPTPHTFVSASLSLEEACEWLDDGCAPRRLFRIDLPAGTTAAYIEPLSPLPGCDDELEVLIAPGVRVGWTEIGWSEAAQVEPLVTADEKSECV